MSSANPAPQTYLTRTESFVSPTAAPTSPAWRVLLIEDSTEGRQLVCNTLSHSKVASVDLDCAARLESALDYLHEREYDALLTIRLAPSLRNLIAFSRRF